MQADRTFLGTPHYITGITRTIIKYFKSKPMTKFNFLAFMFIIVCSSVLVTSCSYDDLADSGSEDTEGLVIDVESGDEYEEFAPEGEVLERSTNRYTFHTLNQALHCTGLNKALFSGIKSIFAPTDEAFEKLGLDKSNVCDIPTEDLTAILLYHVADGAIQDKEVGCEKMLDGNIVQVERNGRKRFVNDVRNTFSFRQFRSARHGRAGYYLKVFGVNEVLTVPTDNIVNTAVGAAPEFTSLVAAVLAADPAIAAALSDEDAVYTVFAPTNQAFADLLAALGLGSLEDAVDAVGVEGLSTILLYHVVDACAFSNDLSDGLEVATLQGETLEVDLDNLAILDKSGTPSGLIPSSLDILTSNGIIHAIDKVLLPQAIIDAL